MQFDRLKRRDFITLLGGAAAWPLAARGQQARLIGFISAGSPDDAYTSALLTGLAESGLLKGRDFEIEHREAEGRLEG